jgi:hypothetical protein
MASLRVHTEPITVRTADKGPYEITDRVSGVVTHSRIVAGSLTVFVQLIGRSPIIMENIDAFRIGERSWWQSLASDDARTPRRNAIERATLRRP